MCEVQASFTVTLPKITCKIPANRCDVMMSFVDNLWSMEISGGSDQSAPLTVVTVKKNGLAKRAGIKVGDIITHINNSPADKLTLIEAQLEIQESGRSLKLTVKGSVREIKFIHFHTPHECFLWKRKSHIRHESCVTFSLQYNRPLYRTLWPWVGLSFLQELKTIFKIFKRSCLEK